MYAIRLQSDTRLENAMPTPADWNEFEDDLADAIADSLEMDWNSRVGAKAVVRWLNENAPAPVPAAAALAKAASA